MTAAAAIGARPYGRTRPLDTPRTPHDQPPSLPAHLPTSRRRLPPGPPSPIPPARGLAERPLPNPSTSADFQTGGQLTAPTIGAIIAVTRQTLYRWRDKGIPWWSADAAAIHAGAHPVELWPDFHTSPTTTGEVAA